MIQRIYLDNAATTPLLPSVIDEMAMVMKMHFANPSSIHAEGRATRTIIERARKTIATQLNASVGEIFFTSGGTEANNMVLKGAVRDHGVNCIITSKIEHHCIIHTVERIAAESPVQVVYVETDRVGRVAPETLRTALEGLTDKKVLVSLMYANNEIGTINPITELADVAHEFGALFHTDTVQAIGYFPIDLSNDRIHFISGAAHKFHGPKGVGFVYINSNHLLKPFLDGGAQERNMRAGTENVYGIHGMAVALEEAAGEQAQRMESLNALNQLFRDEMTRHGIEHRINSPDVGPLLHSKMLNVAFPPSERAQLLVLNMDISGVCISGGSACSSGIESASHVLSTLYPDDQWLSARFSFCHLTSHDDIKAAVAVLKSVLY